MTEEPQRTQWWNEARFGMFVHWGLYSGLAGNWEGKSVGKKGGMEWIQFRVKADSDVYADRAVPLFVPKQEFAADWAKAAKQAGCRYLVFTTKHHDGFALHDSKVSDFDAGTILQRDLVQEIVDACRAEGLRVGFYHSVIDWHHDQYCYADAKQLPHPLNGKPYPNGERSHSKYIDYLHAQVAELVTNYDTVDVLWWDYSSTKFQGDRAWRAFALMNKVRDHQPNVIMNNRLFRRKEAGWSGMGIRKVVPQLDPKYGDFITPEQHVPETGLPGVTWETCMTMNTTWGYSENDHNWKSSEKLVRTLIDIASKGGNYLLNVGPKGDGTIPSQSIERLEVIGRWMKDNGESIYGTSRSVIPQPAWGRVTSKPAESTHYLHVFDWPSDRKLTVDGLDAEITSAVLLKDKSGIPMTKSGSSIVLELPESQPDAIASVIRLRVAN